MTRWGSALRRGALILILLVGGVALAEAAARRSGATPLPISLDHLAPEQAVQVRQLVEEHSFRSEFSDLQFTSQPSVFEYLVDHLDFASQVVRALELSKILIVRTGDGSFLADDRQGMRGELRAVHQGPGQRLFVGRGQGSVRLLPTLYGRSLAFLEYRPALSREGEDLVEARLSLYVKIDSAFWRRLAAWFPFVRRRIEQRLARHFALAMRVSELAYADPPGFIEALAASAEVNREQLNQFAAQLLPEESGSALRPEPQGHARKP